MRKLLISGKEKEAIITRLVFATCNLFSGLVVPMPTLPTRGKTLVSADPEIDPLTVLLAEAEWSVRNVKWRNVKVGADRYATA